MGTNRLHVYRRRSGHSNFSALYFYLHDKGAAMADLKPVEVVEGEVVPEETHKVGYLVVVQYAVGHWAAMGGVGTLEQATQNVRSYANDNPARIIKVTLPIDGSKG
jgi:hypothetical protein